METFCPAGMRIRRGNGFCAGRPESRRSFKKVLELVPERHAEAVCRHVGSDPQQACAQVPAALRDRLVTALTRFRFPVSRAIGVELCRSDSRRDSVGRDQFPYDGIPAGPRPVPGRRGARPRRPDRRGSTFQWAWATGRVAGEARRQRESQCGMRAVADQRNSYPTPKITTVGGFRPGAGWVLSRRLYSTLKTDFYIP